jgi:threonine dehydrogenase-like Zn-dependent dehydrogenase
VLINKAITVVGAYGVDAHACAEAIRITESRRFPVEKLHRRTFELAAATEVIELLGSGKAVHVSISPYAGS